MRVLVVEDQQLFGEALAASLEHEGVEILEIAPTGRRAIASVEESTPDIVLMDLGLPDRDGLDVGREILEHHPDIHIIALTSATDPRMARETLNAGFQGYLTKDARMQELVSVIHAVLGGQSVIPRGMARRLAGVHGTGVPIVVIADQLTDREREVLTLLTQGSTSSEIAAKLGISRNTVRTHVQSILAKLQVHSRLEAAAFAVRHGIVDVHTRLRRADAV